MKNKYILLFLIGSLFSCDSDEKSIEVVLEEVERGAVVRTLDINNVDFNVNDLQSTFTINVEEMDVEDGGLLEEVEIFVQFKDNTPSNGDNSVAAALMETIPASEWITGSNNLPTTSLVYTFEELLATTGLTAIDVAVKDQFLISLNLNLTDGRVFNASNASSIITVSYTHLTLPTKA